MRAVTTRPDTHERFIKKFQLLKQTIRPSLCQSRWIAFFPAVLNRAAFDFQEFGQNCDPDMVNDFENRILIFGKLIPQRFFKNDENPFAKFEIIYQKTIESKSLRRKQKLEQSNRHIVVIRLLKLNRKKNCVICFFTAAQLWFLKICRTTLWEVAILQTNVITNQGSVFCLQRKRINLRNFSLSEPPVAAGAGVHTEAWESKV